MKKLAFIIVAAAVCAAGIFGVSADYSEVADLKLIRVLAIDGNDDEITLTACSGSSSADKEVIIAGTTEKSLSAAINSLRRSATNQEPYFAHVEHFIINEDAAMSDKLLGEVLDYINRSLETRIDTNIYIVRDMSARELILSAAEKNGAAAGMLSFMKQVVDETTSGYVFGCGEITANLAASGTALIQAVRLNTEDELGENAGGKIDPAGLAVIKDAKLVGFLNDDETRGACIIGDVANYSVIDIDLNSGDRVSLGMKEVGAEVLPVFNGDTLEKIEIKVKVSANIEQCGPGVEISSEKVRAELRDKLSQVQKYRLESTIKISKEMGIDYLRMGEKIEFRHPIKFSKIKDKWQSVFVNVPFEIKVETKIERTYDIENMPNMDGEQ